MPQATQGKSRAADQLIELFERKILDGELEAGKPLPAEREIVQGHGVSRTVVREAVRGLASRGLITARPGFRPVVARPGYDTATGVVSSIVLQLLEQPGGVKNLFDLRTIMEASLVRGAAQSATSSDIARLEEALSANFDAIQDSGLFYKTDVAFHGVLYDIPDNPLLPAIHRAYTDWLSTHWQQMPRMPDRNQRNYAFHEDIFEAILRRDPDRAEAAMRDHLEFAWKQVSETLENL
ncbi:MAG: FCD domain-containing protein [Pseudomonadota bacterium]